MNHFNGLDVRKWVLATLGIVVALGASVVVVAAESDRGDEQPLPQATPHAGQACADCHLDISEDWANSPHAHAYDDPFFQERWLGLGEPGECLLCHTTEYQLSEGAFHAEGVACEACHAQTPVDHPPAPVEIRSDTENCGSCHTTTLNEWRLTGHAHADVGCVDCHDPHSQSALFEVADEMCINCHRDDMGAYLEDLHIQKDIGCVDCHALVIPPEMIPDDGIVPTGHTFTITPSTCVACHTDALHAGFSLPGYDHEMTESDAATEEGESELTLVENARLNSPEVEIQDLEKSLEATRAALANQSMATLFQGGVVGLVLGGTTAWFVAGNVRRRREVDGDEE
jgi:hypothetical protein